MAMYNGIKVTRSFIESELELAKVSKDIRIPFIAYHLACEKDKVKTYTMYCSMMATIGRSAVTAVLRSGMNSLLASEGYAFEGKDKTAKINALLGEID
jgi:hypothetical protein